MFFRAIRLAALAAAVVVSGTHAASAAKCGNSAAGFPSWLAQFKQEAQAQGISKQTLDRTLASTHYNYAVIKADRAVKSHFTQTSFGEFYSKRVSSGGIARARGMKAKNAGLLNSIEKRFGVQKEVLVAIWQLESFFGQYTGDISVFQTLPTLAYDCRRSKLFTDNLMSALQIVQRGDMSPAKMKGALFGELGQTQFMAKSYRKHAVDYDGNGRRDLIKSKPDALASTARLLQANGWERGGCYTPGCHNFAVLHAWNESSNYQRTIAKLASQL
jgi:lytic murein transglycosylase